MHSIMALVNMISMPYVFVMHNKVEILHLLDVCILFIPLSRKPLSYAW